MMMVTPLMADDDDDDDGEDNDGEDDGEDDEDDGDVDPWFLARNIRNKPSIFVLRRNIVLGCFRDFPTTTAQWDDDESHDCLRSRVFSPLCSWVQCDITCCGSSCWGSICSVSLQARVLQGCFRCCETQRLDEIGWSCLELKWAWVKLVKSISNPIITIWYHMIPYDCLNKHPLASYSRAFTCIYCRVPGFWHIAKWFNDHLFFWGVG